jgi:lipopolysaccharide/colanic/teichoic acid biosynthesis glycosyltransferase
MNTNNTNLQLITEMGTSGATPIKIAYVGLDFHDMILNELSPYHEVTFNTSLEFLYQDLQNKFFINLPDILLLEADQNDECFRFIEKIKKSSVLKGLLIVILSKHDRLDWKEKARELRVNDFYTAPFKTINLNERIKFLIKLRIINPSQNEFELSHHLKNLNYKIPISKRLFDIMVAGVTLFLLSPLFIIVAIVMRLDSRGPVIYRSKRVGMGYKIFDFYKFRSMKADADSQLTQLSDLNLYTAGENKNKSIFIKISNDPRVTKIGQFIRDTSIDELPQLFNILIGDMSFVGNRPLPLYEAEMLTSNEWSMRFLGPAGLTGLWQVSKRGKKNMSERERMELDNFYARQHSFWLDMKIIIKTIPALIQKEKV